jgi:hypothetical protein
MNTELVDNLPPMDWKYKLAYLAYRLVQTEQTDSHVKHIFVGDEYIREVSYPAGTVILGRVHTNGHLVQLVSGNVVNVTEHGREEIAGPFEFVSVPGYQVLCYALTDIVARTVHKNPEKLTDWKVLEDRDFVPAEVTIERGKMVAQSLLEKAA